MESEAIFLTSTALSCSLTLLGPLGASSGASVLRLRLKKPPIDSEHVLTMSEGSTVQD